MERAGPTSMCGLFKRNYLGLQKFLHRISPANFLQIEVMGTYLPVTGALGWRTWYGAGTPCSQDLSDFYPPHMGVGPAPSVSLPLLPVRMDMVSLIL